MLMEPIAPTPESDRGYSAPTWQTASGETIGARTLVGSLGQMALIGMTLANPPLRAFGMEMSLFPGTAYTRRRNAARPGGMTKRNKVFNAVTQWGFMPDIAPHTGADIMGNYASGRGPILDNSGPGGWLRGKSKGFDKFARHVNEWYVGGDLVVANKHWQAASMDSAAEYGRFRDAIYSGMPQDVPRTGLRGWGQRLSHVHKVAEGEISVNQGTAGMHVLSSRKATQAVAKLERTAMVTSALRTVVIGAAVTAAVQGVLSVAGTVSVSAHDRGVNSMIKSKGNAREYTKSGMSETLRMQALQDAAMSFGAMRAGFGNEAMAFHRY